VHDGYRIIPQPQEVTSTDYYLLSTIDHLSTIPVFLV